MDELKFWGKKNRDGSYSVQIKARDLLAYTQVPFFRGSEADMQARADLKDVEGWGYQRNETSRQTRGKQVANYLRECSQEGHESSLFELTANARYIELVDDRESHSGGDQFQGVAIWEFLDKKSGPIGSLTIRIAEAVKDPRVMYVIDGGTRLLGLEMALAEGSIDEEYEVDVRLFVQKPFVHEISQFLLINDKQKRVRTDLSTRIVQIIKDNLEGKEDLALLGPVTGVDETRYRSSRICGILNKDADSPWHNLIQMPNDPRAGKSIAMQAFSTSLFYFLKNKKIDLALEVNFEEPKDDALIFILKNFWMAIRDINANAAEHRNNFCLWSPIGVSSHHYALNEMLPEFLETKRSVEVDAFKDMLQLGANADNEFTTGNGQFWYTNKSNPSEELKSAYGSERGNATMYTGVSGYQRLGDRLYTNWKRQLNLKKSKISLA